RRVRRAQVRLDGDVLPVPLGVGGQVAVAAVAAERLLVGGVLLDVGQDVEEYASLAVVGCRVTAGGVGQSRGTLPAVGVGTVDRGQADLLEVVGAAHAVGRLAHLLHGGHQQTDQDGDNCYHHQQFDQREATPTKQLDPWHGEPLSQKNRGITR